MSKPTLPPSARSQRSRKINTRSSSNGLRKRARRSNENSDVLISAVISSYLLTDLHQVLQRAEYGALQDGRVAQANNFAQLRKVLCMDARSMEDASAKGMRELEEEKFRDSSIGSKVA